MSTVGRSQALLPGLVFFAGLIVTMWVYWPGHTGPSLLDDQSSVRVLDGLGQNPELAWDFVMGDGSGPLGRPVSLASFVLEKLLIGDSVAIGKQVNIWLHLFNGGILCSLFVVMLRALRFPGYRELATVFAVAWMISPLYVSTVLYVVQRMAMISTTFMLLTILSYCSWREQLLMGKNRPGMMMLVPLFGVLALFAKENAVVVVPILLLIEALWFQFRGFGGDLSKPLRTFTLLGISVGTLGLGLFFFLYYDTLVASYANRYFSLNERLMTESRILWDYVGQLIWPEVNRMGVYHDDVIVSKSLDSPKSTAVAVYAWVALLVVTLVSMRWRSGRYLALGVLWFLVGHSVESTVLPLELYFEHRNYFPGIGLFLLLAVGAGQLLKVWPELRAPLFFYGLFYCLWLALFTSSQVQVWSSRQLVTLNHVNAHSESFRANTDMAVLMAELGELESARSYSKKAFAVSKVRVERYGDYEIRDLALSCIANQPVSAERIDSFGNENAARPLSSVATLHTLVRLLQENACSEFDRIGFADRMAEIFLVEDYEYKASAEIYSSLAVLENALLRFELALRYTNQFLVLSPDNTRGLLMKLHFTTALGRAEQAQETVRHLQRMERSGLLTVGESQTLALYLEES